MDINNSHKANFTEIYKAALSAVNGKQCVVRFLTDKPVSGNIYLLAIGKAALAMAAGAAEVLDSRLKDNLVITTPRDTEIKQSNLNVFYSSHPIPDERCLEAGQRVVDFVDAIPEGGKLLCLISGGTSALVEVLPENIGLEQLQQLNQWLLQSGLPISHVNAIRKRVSCIKGGKLAARLKHPATVLLISDVKGDRVSDIGSGLFFSAPEDDDLQKMQHYPDHVKRLLEDSPPLLHNDTRCTEHPDYSIVATLEDAKQAACLKAKEQGYDVIVHESYLEGDAVQAGQLIAREAVATRGKLHIWGGECTVTLPSKPGIGGRCQSLALSAAISLQAYSEWCLLAAGTDGSDGTGNVAGAIVDNGSLSRAGTSSVNVEIARDYLQRADAGSYLEKSDDLLVVGDTETNVADLVLAYCE